MKVRELVLPSIKDPIKKSPGFHKKELADFKLDIMGKCGFSCSYCSTAATTPMRVNREKWADEAERQLGERLLPSAPNLTYRWSDFEERLDAQLATKPKDYVAAIVGLFGEGKTLVFSQLTDAFSPWAVAEGLTRRTLDKVLDRTSFRVRVLTKSAVVGSPAWVDYFKAHPGRFVVGLSIGTLDDNWARKVEVGTSSPTSRVKALHALQDAGVPTYGMLCPIFPDALNGDGVERLVEAIRPERCETVWSEAFNDRDNWRSVAAGYEHGTPAHDRMTSLFSGADRVLRWTDYATDVYRRVHAALGSEAHKHRYLLYQDTMTAQGREALRGAEGMLFQSDETKGKKSLPVVGGV